MTDLPPAAPEDHRSPVGENRSPALIARGGGCFIALVLSALLFTLVSSFNLPEILLLVTSAFAGLGLLRLYAHVARDRWQATPPDSVQMLAQDLGGLVTWRFKDYRLKFDRTWPFRERMLHEVLYWLKWLGHILIIAGLGGAIYRLLTILGVISAPP